MGGGTLLIPLLTMAAGLEQHLAQAVNLMAFIPMSVVALFIHKKNGYVDVKLATPVMFLALLGAIGGSFAASYSGGYALRAAYGAFLTALGIFQLVKTIVCIVKRIREKKSAKSTVIKNA